MDREEFRQACAKGRRAFKRVFARVVDEYEGLFYRRVLRWFGGQEAWAHDVVQDTFLKVWENCGEFAGRSSLDTWLHAILRNTFLDLVRKQRPVESMLDESGQPRPDVEEALAAAARRPLDPESIAADAERLRDLALALDAFAAAHPTEAADLALLILEEPSMEDMARLMGRSSAGAARERLYQCRKKARPFLAAWCAAYLSETDRVPVDER